MSSSSSPSYYALEIQHVNYIISVFASIFSKFNLKNLKKYYFACKIEINLLSLHSESTSETCSPSSEDSLEANGRFISSILLRSLVFSIGDTAWSTHERQENHINILFYIPF